MIISGPNTSKSLGNYKPLILITAEMSLPQRSFLSGPTH